jgi:hypothetical protein
MKSLLQRVSGLVQPSLHYLTSSESAPASLGPEEVLVADSRGSLTPVQMVDQKVMALLGSNYPGHFSQGSGGLGNIRRIPGK